LSCKPCALVSLKGWEESFSSKALPPSTHTRMVKVWNITPPPHPPWFFSVLHPLLTVQMFDSNVVQAVCAHRPKRLREVQFVEGFGQ